MNKVLTLILILSLFGCSVSKTAKTTVSSKETNGYCGIYALNQYGAEVHLENTSRTFRLDSLPSVLFADIEKVKKTHVSLFNRTPMLSIQLNEPGSKAFEKVSSENIGNELVIVYNNQLLLAAKIVVPISGGHIVVSGLNDELIDEVVMNLK